MRWFLFAPARCMLCHYVGLDVWARFAVGLPCWPTLSSCFTLIHVLCHPIARQFHDPNLLDLPASSSNVGLLRDLPLYQCDIAIALDYRATDLWVNESLALRFFIRLGCGLCMCRHCVCVFVFLYRQRWGIYVYCRTYVC